MAPGQQPARVRQGQECLRRPTRTPGEREPNARLHPWPTAHIFVMYRFDTSFRGIAFPATLTTMTTSAGAAEVRTVVGGPRSGVLELAVLGLLHDTPMHGYELRKRLNALLGAFRAFGYGSLYPCLKDLLAQGLIAEEQPDPAGKPLGSGRRSKIVYRLTAEGKERLQQLLAEPGPAAWEDDGFGIRFAFFGQTRADIRLRILEGRRTRLEERLDGVRAAMARTRERLDSYTLELHRHGLREAPRRHRPAGHPPR